MAQATVLRECVFSQFGLEDPEVCFASYMYSTVLSRAYDSF